MSYEGVLRVRRLKPPFLWRMESKTPGMQKGTARNATCNFLYSYQANFREMRSFSTTPTLHTACVEHSLISRFLELSILVEYIPTLPLFISMRGIDVALPFSVRYYRGFREFLIHIIIGESPFLLYPI